MVGEAIYSETITCKHSFAIQGVSTKKYNCSSYDNNSNGRQCNVNNYKLYPPIVIAMDWPHGVDGTQEDSNRLRLCAQCVPATVSRGKNQLQVFIILFMPENKQ